MTFFLFSLLVCLKVVQKGETKNLVKHAIGKYYYIAKFSYQGPTLQAISACWQDICLFVPRCYIWTSCACSVDRRMDR